MDRRGADRTSEAARRRLELLARELSRLDPPTRPSGERDEEVEDLFDDTGLDNAGLDDRRLPARHRAGAAVTASRWGSDAVDRLPNPLRSVLGDGTTLSHVVVVAAVVLVAGGAVLWWVQRAQPEVVTAEPVALSSPVAGSSPTAPAEPGAPAAPTAAPSEVVVDVAGKVRRPGIVTLPVGSRVVDALEAAGGARRGAELTSLNLARVLVDGEQIVVGLPAVSVPSGPAPGGASPGAPGGAVVNLNTATLEELDTLPQVGPVTAQAILAWRTDHGRFTSVDELLEVDGIGEATLAKLRALVTV
ncbi:ComEA family DNA-binding protein [Mumia quercus]|uniref:ComEA family DNA-binding protein n=1 Tax=Mumia quercus TaxID=2976125 RepID=UPI0021D18B49|nr:ComEA family DNA-binding protein [Mumia quercus]